MRGRLFLVLTASLLPWTVAGAQPPSAEPDPDAMEIARAMIGSMPFLNPPADPTREEQSLEADLLSIYGSEPPCDRANAECLAAARAVAREYTPAIRRRAELFRDRAYAFGVMDQLPPEQRHRLAAWLRSGEGRDFIGVWQLLFQPPVSAERRQAAQCRASAGLGEPRVEARRVFAERTAGLPRSKEQRPYIVPPIPPPPPRC